jgi:hypothetical protein
MDLDISRRSSTVNSAYSMITGFDIAFEGDLMLRSHRPSLALVLCGVVCGVLLGPAISGGLNAANWPRFRGANGVGVAETEGLPVHFGPEQNVV